MVQPPHAFEGLGLDGVRGVGLYGAVELLGVEDAEGEEKGARGEGKKEREEEGEEGAEVGVAREVGCYQGWVGVFV